MRRSTGGAFNAAGWKQDASDISSRKHGGDGKQQKSQQQQQQQEEDAWKEVGVQTAGVSGAGQRGSIEAEEDSSEESEWTEVSSGDWQSNKSSGSSSSSYYGSESEEEDDSDSDLDEEGHDLSSLQVREPEGQRGDVVLPVYASAASCGTADAGTVNTITWCKWLEAVIVLGGWLSGN